MSVDSGVRNGKPGNSTVRDKPGYRAYLATLTGAVALIMEASSMLSQPCARSQAPNSPPSAPASARPRSRGSSGLPPRQMNNWCRGRATVPVWAALIGALLQDESPEALMITLEEATMIVEAAQSPAREST